MILEIVIAIMIGWLALAFAFGMIVIASIIMGIMEVY